jgi:hypothetical protein
MAKNRPQRKAISPNALAGNELVWLSLLARFLLLHTTPLTAKIVTTGLDRQVGPSASEPFPALLGDVNSPPAGVARVHASLFPRTSRGLGRHLANYTKRQTAAKNIHLLNRHATRVKALCSPVQLLLYYTIFTNEQGCLMRQILLPQRTARPRGHFAQRIGAK